MEPDAVVEASLNDLEHGVVMSIPGASDESSLHAFTVARRTPSITREVDLPTRYAAP